MKYFILSVVVLSIFTSCATDLQKQEEFSGTYEVSIEAKETQKEMEKAKKEMKKELKQARKDIDKEFENAKKEIENEFGEDSNFGKAVGSFVEGIGHLSKSMTELGESLGELGINLGSDILENVRFNASFREDGEVVLGKTGKVTIHTDDLRWKIQNGKMLLWDRDNDEDDVQEFEIKNISDSEIDLIGKEVIFHLRKNKEE